MPINNDLKNLIKLLVAKCPNFVSLFFEVFAEVIKFLQGFGGYAV